MDLTFISQPSYFFFLYPAAVYTLFFGLGWFVKWYWILPGLLLWYVQTNFLWNHVPLGRTYPPVISEHFKLSYPHDRNLPVLELYDTTPYERGYWHARALYPQIVPFIHRLKVIQFLLPVVTEAVVIPEKIEEELRGFAQGYNDMGTDHLTYEFVLRYHMLPDLKNKHSIISAACTTILGRELTNDLYIARNTDWCPFGTGGSDSLIITYRANNRTLHMFGPPGFIGVGAGTNEDLSLCMNVCPGVQHKGIPSSLFNKLLLETYEGSLERVMDYVDHFPPLGSFHLTLANVHGEGRVIRFYQQSKFLEDTRHMVTELKEFKPLSVFNYFHPEKKVHSFDSVTRERLFKQQLSQVQHFDAVVASKFLQTPGVNAWMTIHHMMFFPVRRTLLISRGNGWAATEPYVEYQY